MILIYEPLVHDQWLGGTLVHEKSHTSHYCGITYGANQNQPTYAHLKLSTLLPFQVAV